MFNLTSPSEARLKAAKKASRVMSSLKNTLWSTLSKTPKQHLKEQKPKYQLCSNPTITITDAETGEEWDFVDHDELDGDLANSDDTRTLREELEINAREQEDLLTPRLRQHHPTIANMGMQIPSDSSSKSPAEGTKPSMFSMLVKKVTALIKGPSDKEKESDQNEEPVVIQPEDAIEPWEVIPTVKDDPWSVVVKSHNVLAEFDDSASNCQNHYERTYQYEFDCRVVQADRIAQREAVMRASK
ncbi:hypothetical protein FAGAP_10716 [Fusarium agapanthi]|uniref:Uncharacterized protein n=1 Tax=Fusarium agapanthi TaxID=1803897 RepID=A0A9P5E3W8_9HYPO|nr:hypothetical protein FAGAP_10716 [Fusarium agapanthi]